MEQYDVEHSLVTVGGSAFLWGDVNDNASNSIYVPPPGSVAAICALHQLTSNEAEYFKTRSLVIEHLWELKGNSLL